MKTPADEIADLTASLIAIPSLSGEERPALEYLEKLFSEWGWPIERQPISPNLPSHRYNLFCSFGVPRILFTTHIDVVPGPSALFTPIRQGETLIGRGACDAKGSLATMIVLAKNLLREGADNFALLVVVGEETDGIGAKTAAQLLQGRGIEHLINGEPTEARFASAGKGVLDFEVTFSGRSCHSGYPELGEDANRKLMRCLFELEQADFGSDPVLGKSLVNVGRIQAGVASNVISSRATMAVCLRTVGADNSREKEFIRQLCHEGELRFGLDAPRTVLSFPEWEETPFVAAYGTDVPNFAALACEKYLCGPGSIIVAHTDEERVTLPELAAAYLNYQRLFKKLSA
jgi:acetylornithine deacetylase